MSYRPITDRWILARAKLTPYPDGTKRSYYGAYLGGFPERARVLLGATLEEPVLHVCGGMARFYPYPRGIGRYDRTMDLNQECEPDFLMDCRETVWPSWSANDVVQKPHVPWRAILIDPPYSEEHAAKYAPGASKYPNPNKLVQTAVNHVPIGCKVGMIHFVWPRCPKNALEVASISVTCGRDNRERAFIVLERTS